MQGAAELARYGADRIRVVEADSLAHYSGEGYTALVAEEAKSARPAPASVIFEVEAKTKARSAWPAASQRSRMLAISRRSSVR